MNTFSSIGIVSTLLCLTLLGIRGYRKREASFALERLSNLHQLGLGQQTEQSKDYRIGEEGTSLTDLEGWFAQAGYLTRTERRHLKASGILLLFIFSLSGILIGQQFFESLGLIIGVGVGLYLGGLTCLFYLKICRTNLEQQILYQLPLVLESLILLVESGLGVLPAIEKLMGRQNQKNPVIYHLRLVYELSASGLPFGAALQKVSDACQHRVLRHVLLHLDIGASEGGQIVPSLRSLSNHTHTEWRLSIEQRVKKLENLVVFPVFASVLGLLLLTAAVPLVPLLEISQQIQSNTNSIGSLKGHDNLYVGN